MVVIARRARGYRLRVAAASLQGTTRNDTLAGERRRLGDYAASLASTMSRISPMIALRSKSFGV